MKDAKAKKKKKKQQQQAKSNVTFIVAYAQWANVKENDLNAHFFVIQ